jgi:hypothetical protein
MDEADLQSKQHIKKLHLHAQVAKVQAKVGSFSKGERFRRQATEEAFM